MNTLSFENTVKKIAQGANSSGSIVVDFEDYNGWCIKTEDDDTVYLVMSGEKCRFPDQAALDAIFNSRDIHDGTSIVGRLWTSLGEQMPTGPDISEGAQLMRADNEPGVFLLTNRKKYGITSEDQFNSCNFSWKKIHVYPKIIIDSIPDGGNHAFDRP